MALVNDTKKSANITFVHLAGGEKMGFKHRVPGVDENGVANVITNTYNSVTGIPSGLSMKQELIYAVSKDLRDKGQDPSKADLSQYDDDQKKWVGALMLKDPVSNEMISVSFPLSDSLGGKIIGMLNTLRLENRLGEDMKLRTFHSPANTKINTSDKSYDSINMRPNGSEVKEADIKAVYMKNDSGDLLLKEDGTPDMLPMGVITGRSKGKDVWAFTERDNLIMETAMVVLDNFKAMKDAQTQTQTQAQTQAHAHDANGDGGDEGGVDLDEAMRAAGSAPH